MKFYVLASGSKGNATLVMEKSTKILIDCGITQREMKQKLAALELDKDDIDYVLLTHDHRDHKKNIHMFDKNKLYSAKGNIELVDKNHELNHYHNYQFGDLNVFVLACSHDATNTCAFKIIGKESFLYMTDTGYVSNKNRQYIKDLNYYVIEANHDIEMLMNTNRPYVLKNRILGDKGHLNNEYSAHLMCELIGENTKEVCLAHLSEEANTKEKALETYHQILNEAQIPYHFKLKCADQKIMTPGGSHEY